MTFISYLCIKRSSKHYFLAISSFSIATLPPNHVDNYYMEREWRVAGKVEFAVKDIANLYVAQAFLNQATQDFPDLAGNIIALDT